MREVDGGPRLRSHRVREVVDGRCALGHVGVGGPQLYGYDVEVLRRRRCEPTWTCCVDPVGRDRGVR